MLGERLLSKSKIAVSNEAAMQHALVGKEMDTLVEMTGKGWTLVQNETFDKVRVKCYCEGAAVMAVGIAIGELGYVAYDKIKRRRLLKRVEQLKKDIKQAIEKEES